MNLLFILASLTAAIALAGATVSEEHILRVAQLTNTVNSLQDPTYPSCGDCVYGDFRGDNGAPGTQVCKKRYFHMLLYSL